MNYEYIVNGQLYTLGKLQKDKEVKYFHKIQLIKTHERRTSKESLSLEFRTKKISVRPRIK